MLFRRDIQCLRYLAASLLMQPDVLAGVKIRQALGPMALVPIIVTTGAGTRGYNCKAQKRKLFDWRNIENKLG